MLDAAFLIPAFPLAGFLLLAAFGHRLRDPGAGWLATGAMAGSFVSTLVVWAGLLGRHGEERVFTQTLWSWVPVGGLHVDAALLVDTLSITMALFVTGVGTLIHLYSIGYMHGDERYPRFFVYLNLFAFSMLMLVLGDNLLLTFLGWEGVGACSYLLISFWFERPTAATAGKKAFVVNRIGDFGFMLASFLVFAHLGSLAYREWLPESEELATGTALAIALLLFLGAVGKSAQLPLYVWLPDAMEGPTPVSALIHAATMVTAGVYLMVRVNPLLHHADDAATVIAVVGAATALFAATIAVAQDDIKKVLAYSTVSQLGYMFLAVGSGAYVAAIFHMVTHAFFKALLFLGAGSVIHGLHDEQDMKRMGGLRSWMPITAGTFIVGWLAIAGIPPFAGFWSKDEILAAAFDKSPLLWAVGALTALLTAYYMSRQVFLVFYGDERWRHADHPAPADDEPETTTPEPVVDEAAAAHGAHGHSQPHEAPWTMWAPLLALAVLSVLGGALNLPWKQFLTLEHWLEPVLAEPHHLAITDATKWALALAATVIAIAGIAVARQIWLVGGARHDNLEPTILKRAWGVDGLYEAVVEAPGRALAAFSAFVVDARIIDGAVNGSGNVVRVVGGQLRRLQTGYVRNYALGVAAGSVLLLGWALLRAGV